MAYPPKGLFLRPEATIISRSGRPRFLAAYRRRRQKIASGHDSTVAGEQGGNSDPHKDGLRGRGSKVRQGPNHQPSITEGSMAEILRRSRLSDLVLNPVVFSTIVQMVFAERVLRVDRELPLHAD